MKAEKGQTDNRVIEVFAKCSKITLGASRLKTGWIVQILNMPRWVRTDKQNQCNALQHPVPGLWVIFILTN